MKSIDRTTDRCAQRRRYDEGAGPSCPDQARRVAAHAARVAPMIHRQPPRLRGRPVCVIEFGRTFPSVRALVIETGWPESSCHGCAVNGRRYRGYRIVLTDRMTPDLWRAFEAARQAEAIAA